MNKREEDPRQKGNLAEKLFEVECIKRDILLFAPIGDGCRIDYIAEINGELKKVQIKYVSAYKDKIQVSFAKTQNGRRNEDGSPIIKLYRKDEVDLFFVFCPDTNKWYNIPIELASNQRCFALRLHPTKNNQSKGVNIASEFEW